MATTPARIRNWATIVRSGEELHPDFRQRLADMLDFAATRIEELEDENTALLRDLDMLEVGPWDGR